MCTHLHTCKLSSRRADVMTTGVILEKYLASASAGQACACNGREGGAQRELCARGLHAILGVGHQRAGALVLPCVVAGPQQSFVLLY